MTAFLIGVRLPSWWWVTGPLAAFLASAMALILPTAIWPQIPRSTPIGTVTPKEELLFGLVWAIPGVALFSILYALVAGAGVWWGQRREDLFPPRPNPLGDNARQADRDGTRR